MSIQRWRPAWLYDTHFIESEDGPWVRYDDHVAALAEARAKNMPWTCSRDGTLNPHGFACIECIRLAAYAAGLEAAAPRTLTADDPEPGVGSVVLVNGLAVQRRHFGWQVVGGKSHFLFERLFQNASGPVTLIHDEEQA